MSNHEYYSARTGKMPSPPRIGFPKLKTLSSLIIRKHIKNGYLEEAFGYRDLKGWNEGLITDSWSDEEINSFIFIELKKEGLWPIDRNIADYTEDDLFDIIELFYRIISKPSVVPDEVNLATYPTFHLLAVLQPKGYLTHKEFSKAEAQKEYRDDINKVLVLYKDGFELSKEGSILIKLKDGLAELLVQPEYLIDNDNVESRIHRAVEKFQRSRSSIEEKIEAVRILADVMEYVDDLLGGRGTMNGVQKDEQDLYNIVNNFGIRHSKKSQQRDYQKEPYLTWMFFSILATIRLKCHYIATGEELG